MSAKDIVTGDFVTPDIVTGDIVARHRSVAGAHVAARGEAYVGCSGWSYPHWRGTVYDPAMRQKDWFSDYARRFRTVEVNNTFYKLPEAATFQRVARPGPRRLCVRPQAQPVRDAPPPAARTPGLAG